MESDCSPCPHGILLVLWYRVVDLTNFCNDIKVCTMPALISVSYLFGVFIFIFQTTTVYFEPLDYHQPYSPELYSLNKVGRINIHQNIRLVVFSRDYCFNMIFSGKTQGFQMLRGSPTRMSTRFWDAWTMSFLARSIGEKGRRWNIGGYVHLIFFLPLTPKWPCLFMPFHAFLSYMNTLCSLR